MKFKSYPFLIGLISGFTYIGDIYAKDCPAGKFSFVGTSSSVEVCGTCPEGCYCSASGRENINILTIDKWCKNKKFTCSSGEVSINGGKQCGNSDAAGVFRCPDEFPGSVAGTRFLSSCYRYFGNKQVFYRETKCNPGEYLPMQSNECVKCLSGYNCPGGTFRASADKNQGLGDDGGDINCIAGTYLPANSETCAPCPDGFYCPQGNYAKAVIDQGNKQCPDGNVPNYDKTACIVDEHDINVNPGYFLPANSVTPQTCFGVANDKQYCPGGIFDKDSKRQGIESCPNNGRSNTNRDSCSFTLTKQQMMYGINGAKTGNKDNRCWAITDVEDFQVCVLGAKLSIKGSNFENDKPNAASVATKLSKGSGNSVDASKVKLKLHN